MGDYEVADSTLVLQNVEEVESHQKEACKWVQGVFTLFHWISLLHICKPLKSQGLLHRAQQSGTFFHMCAAHSTVVVCILRLQHIKCAISTIWVKNALGTSLFTTMFGGSIAWMILDGSQKTNVHKPPFHHYFSTTSTTPQESPSAATSVGSGDRDVLWGRLPQPNRSSILFFIFYFFYWNLYSTME